MKTIPVKLTTWLAGAALLALFTMATRTEADPDLWGHVRFGMDIIETRSLPSTDPYSFTQDRAWINHEWLSEIQMGAAYEVFGSAGLALLKASLSLLAFWLVWSALQEVRFEARLLAIAAAVVGAVQIAQTLRPQLWSLVCVAFLCRTLTRPEASRRRWLPLLFVVWANLHGGWIVGLAILAVWVGVESVVNNTLRPRDLIVLVGCVLATLLTPYGFSLWRFLAETVHASRPAIEEWQPLWRLQPDKWIPWAGTAAAVSWAAARPFRGRAAAVAVLTMLALASLRVARVEPLFAVATAILLAPRLGSAWPPRRGDVFGKDPRTEGVLVAIVVVAALGIAGWVLPTTLRCVATSPLTSPDLSVLDALGRAQPGRLVTFFNWGEFALWHVGPRIKVSMDGRRETVYSDARLAEHDAILFGTSAAWSTLAAWSPEYVWLPSTSLTTRNWLVTHGYRIDAQTPRSFLAVRADLPRVLSEVPVREPAPWCFPN